MFHTVLLYNQNQEAEGVLPNINQVKEEPPVTEETLLSDEHVTESTFVAEQTKSEEVPYKLFQANSFEKNVNMNMDVEDTGAPIIPDSLSTMEVENPEMSILPDNTSITHSEDSKTDINELVSHVKEEKPSPIDEMLDFDPKLKTAVVRLSDVAFNNPMSRMLSKGDVVDDYEKFLMVNIKKEAEEPGSTNEENRVTYDLVPNVKDEHKSDTRIQNEIPFPNESSFEVTKGEDIEIKEDNKIESEYQIERWKSPDPRPNIVGNLSTEILDTYNMIGSTPLLLTCKNEIKVTNECSIQKSTVREEEKGNKVGKLLTSAAQVLDRVEFLNSEVITGDVGMGADMDCSGNNFGLTEEPNTVENRDSASERNESSSSPPKNSVRSTDVLKRGCKNLKRVNSNTSSPSFSPSQSSEGSDSDWEQEYLSNQKTRQDSKLKNISRTRVKKRSSNNKVSSNQSQLNVGELRNSNAFNSILNDTIIALLTTSRDALKFKDNCSEKANNTNCSNIELDGGLDSLSPMNSPVIAVEDDNDWEVEKTLAQKDSISKTSSKPKVSKSISNNKINSSDQQSSDIGKSHISTRFDSLINNTIKQLFTYNSSQETTSNGKHLTENMVQMTLTKATTSKDQHQIQNTAPSKIEQIFDTWSKGNGDKNDPAVEYKYTRKKGQYMCDVCGKRFNNNVYLAAHKNIHDNVTPYKCPICDKGFRAKYLMNNHIKVVHHNKVTKHLCRYCGETTKSQEHLKAHEATHELPPGSEIPEPFKCPDCGKEFISQFKLKTHQHRHLGRKCSECPERFRTKGSLKYHLKDVHGIVIEYKCDLCGKVFAYKEGLRVHKVNHSAVVKFFCDICDKGFKQKHQIEQHMITHSDARPISCSQCDETFKRKTHLKQHILAFHQK